MDEPSDEQFAEWMQKMVEQQARVAAAQEEHNAHAHPLPDYRMRSLDLSIASFQPHAAHEVSNEVITARAQAFYDWLTS